MIGDHLIGDQSWFD